MAKKPTETETSQQTPPLGMDGPDAQPAAQSTAPPAESAAEGQIVYDRKDGGTLARLTAEDLDRRPRLGKTVVICPYHQVYCEARSTKSAQYSPDPYFTWFSCPVADCTFSQKVVRPTLRDHLRRHGQDEEFSAR